MIDISFEEKRILEEILRREKARANDDSHHRYYRLEDMIRTLEILDRAVLLTRSILVDDKKRRIDFSQVALIGDVNREENEYWIEIRRI